MQILIRSMLLMRMLTGTGMIQLLVKCMIMLIKSMDQVMEHTLFHNGLVDKLLSIEASNHSLNQSNFPQSKSKLGLNLQKMLSRLENGRYPVLHQNK
jgi:hypothetical protein